MSKSVVIEEDRLYTVEDVEARCGLKERKIRELAADPACPLKFVWPRHGRKKVCTAAVLRAFLAWMVSEDDVKAGV
jgi:anaerobic selenocysteine-containing dehydrogenase